MSARILSSAILASMLLATAVPVVALAAEDAAPKTKTACHKANMKWDDATKTCVKK